MRWGALIYRLFCSMSSRIQQETLCQEGLQFTWARDTLFRDRNSHLPVFRLRNSRTTAAALSRFESSRGPSEWGTASRGWQRSKSGLHLGFLSETLSPVRPQHKNENPDFMV
jgi:hypothetical protein